MLCVNCNRKKRIIVLVFPCSLKPHENFENYHMLSQMVTKFGKIYLFPPIYSAKLCLSQPTLGRRDVIFQAKFRTLGLWPLTFHLLVLVKRKAQRGWRTGTCFRHSGPMLRLPQVPRFSFVRFSACSDSTLECSIYCSWHIGKLQFILSIQCQESV